MKFYSQVIFPLAMDWAMSDSVMAQYRQEVLAEVSGEVLEIGFGTGLNLPYYPQTLQKITAIDPNPGMRRLAQKRVKASKIAVDYQLLKGESLPMLDNFFDSVVSTWTLCSIPQVEQAISEICRVLKPGGKFCFIEHGLSQETQVQLWQNRLTPIQKVIGDGCHLNRNIRELIQQQFKQVNITEFYARNLPKFIGYMYKGVAIK